MSGTTFDGLIESLDEAIENGDIESAIKDLVGAALAAEGQAANVKLVKQRLKDVITLLDDADWEEEEEDDEETDDGEE
jgi:hypothetical protein